MQGHMAKPHPTQIYDATTRPFDPIAERYGRGVDV